MVYGLELFMVYGLEWFMVGVSMVLDRYRPVPVLIFPNPEFGPKAVPNTEPINLIWYRYGTGNSVLVPNFPKITIQYQFF